MKTWSLKALTLVALAGAAAALTLGLPKVAPFSAAAQAVQLTNGVPLASQSVGFQQWRYYSITVPSGATSLVVTTTNATADVDLFTRSGSQPTSSSNAACARETSSGNETYTHTNPQAGTWWFGVYGYAAGSYTITATYSGGSTTPPVVGAPSPTNYSDTVITFGQGAGAKRVRVYVVQGASGIYLFTQEQLATPPQTTAGAFGNCPGSPFAYAWDTNANRFPNIVGTIQVYSDFAPYTTLPGGAAGASWPDVRLIRSDDGEEGLLIVVRGNDGNIYRTVLDANCDGHFPIVAFDSVPAGYGDPDHDGFPGIAGSNTPWQRISP